MAEIKNDVQYQKLLDRIEELLQVVGNETLIDDQNYIELDILSDLVAEYEEKYYPIIKPPPFTNMHKERKKRKICIEEMLKQVQHDPPIDIMVPRT